MTCSWYDATLHSDILASNVARWQRQRQSHTSTDNFSLLLDSLASSHLTSFHLNWVLCDWSELLHTGLLHCTTQFATAETNRSALSSTKMRSDVLRWMMWTTGNNFVIKCHTLVNLSSHADMQTHVNSTSNNPVTLTTDLKVNACYHLLHTRSTQPCIPLGLLNRVPALIGWG